MPLVGAIDNTPLSLQAMGAQAQATSVQNSLSRALDRIDPATKIPSEMSALKTQYPEIYEMIMMFPIEEVRREGQRKNDRVIAEMKKLRLSS